MILYLSLSLIHAGVDFEVLNFTVTFSSSALTQSIYLLVYEDNLSSDDRQFSLIFTTINTFVTIAVGNRVTVQLRNEDGKCMHAWGRSRSVDGFFRNNYSKGIRRY